MASIDTETYEVKTKVSDRQFEFLEKRAKELGLSKEELLRWYIVSDMVRIVDDKRKNRNIEKKRFRFYAYIFLYLFYIFCLELGLSSKNLRHIFPKIFIRNVIIEIFIKFFFILIFIALRG